MTADRPSLIITNFCSQTTHGENHCTITRRCSKHSSCGRLNPAPSERRQRDPHPPYRDKSQRFQPDEVGPVAAAAAAANSSKDKCLLVDQILSTLCNSTCESTWTGIKTGMQPTGSVYRLMRFDSKYLLPGEETLFKTTKTQLKQQVVRFVINILS